MQSKLAQLRQVVPECFAEGTLDIEKLRKTLGHTLDSGEEKYALSWAGRNDTFRNIQEPTRSTLVPDKQGSVNFDDAENVFIEGENLMVLKLLQKSYFGKVKMIYIDPPYNTGKDFIYKDNFRRGRESYLEQTGQAGGGIRLTTNLDTSGRFHSDWISIMYARLYLARNLLRDDGVIFVSIDDNEAYNLRLIMNEVFGEENFYATLNWTARNKPMNAGSARFKIRTCSSTPPFWAQLRAHCNVGGSGGTPQFCRAVRPPFPARRRPAGPVNFF